MPIQDRAMRLAELGPRKIGLDASMPLPVAAMAMGAAAILVVRTANSSRDTATLRRILAHLQTM
ncbi:hypothetical protein HDA40_006953 [Hamadaea flava]|nr:hypothetical protein [Hamadaea flava]